MILLTDTSTTVQLKITANSNVAWTTSWTDSTSTGMVAGASQGVLNVASQSTTVVAALGITPASRQVWSMTFVNTDAANTQNVQISITNGGSTANLMPAANLQPGYGLMYNDEQGFSIIDTQGLTISQINVSLTGDVTGNGTNNIAVTLANTGVIAGTYNLSSIQVDSKGRVVAANSGNVFANSALVGSAQNLSFVSANTSNLTVVGTLANGNVVITLDNPKLGGSGTGGGSNLSISIDTFTATVNQNTFVMSQPASNANNVLVFKNGLEVSPNGGYTVSGNTVVLVSNSAANDIIETKNFIGGGSVLSNLVILLANTTVLNTVNTLNFTNTSTVNALVVANGTWQVNVGFAVNTSAISAQTGILVNGSPVGNGVNINFVAANTSNLSIIGTQNVTPGNVTVSIDTRNPPGSGGSSGFPSIPGTVPNLLVWLGTDKLTEPANANVQLIPSLNPQRCPFYILSLFANTAPNEGPYIDTANVNGLPVLAFSNTANGNFTSPGTLPFIFALQMTYFVVMNPGTSVIGDHISGAQHAMNVQMAANQHMVIAESNIVVKATSNVALTSNTWQQVMVQWNNTTSAYQFRIGRANAGIGTASSFASTIIPTTAYFYNGQVSANFFGGKFGEMLIYNRFLTAAEIANVESYLLAKWGV